MSSWLELCTGVCFVHLAHLVETQLGPSVDMHQLHCGSNLSRFRCLILFPFSNGCLPADVGRGFVEDTDVFKHGGLHCREIQSRLGSTHARVCVCVWV